MSMSPWMLAMEKNNDTSVPSEAGFLSLRFYGRSNSCLIKTKVGAPISTLISPPSFPYPAHQC